LLSLITKLVSFTKNDKSESIINFEIIAKISGELNITLNLRESINE